MKNVFACTVQYFKLHGNMWFTKQVYTQSAHMDNNMLSVVPCSGIFQARYDNKHHPKYESKKYRK